MRLSSPPRSRLLASLSGILLALGTPPFDLYFLAWIGIIPLIVALKERTGSGFGEGATSGVFFNGIVVYWLSFNSGTNPLIAVSTAVATSTILIVGWGTASWLFCRLYDRYGENTWWILPFSWTTWEGLLTCLGDIAFPWPVISLTQSAFLPGLQIMEFTGIWGVTFWVVLTNVCIYFIWLGSSKSLKRFAFAIIAINALIPAWAQWHAYSHLDNNPASVRTMVVQGSIPPYEKWVRGDEFSWTIYDSTTTVGAQIQKPELIIWPETALPSRIMHQSLTQQKLSELSSDLNSSILTGASDYKRFSGVNRPLNSAFLVSPGSGVIQRCAKRVLVPFGERVPFQTVWSGLGKLNFGQAEFLPGDRPMLFETTGGVRFPAMICFESAFPHVSREAVLQGANLLVTISNDAWYGNATEAHQIAALSRFRCIETRRSMARSSNTGISFLSDPMGREIERSEMWKPDWVYAELPLSDELTFYVIHGDLFLAAVSLIYAVFLIWNLNLVLKADDD